MGPKRTLRTDFPVGHGIGNNPRRQGPLLPPLLEGGQHVESVGAFAASAVRHAWHHEQADRTVRLALAEGTDDVLVVINGSSRRDNRVGPPMIDEEFAAASNELFQIRRRRAECAAIDLSGKLHMLCEIKGAKIPVWILEHHVLEQIVGDAKRLWSGSLAGPEQLASRFQAGRDFLARLRVF